MGSFFNANKNPQKRENLKQPAPAVLIVSQGGGAPKEEGEEGDEKFVMLEVLKKYRSAA